MKKLTLSKVHKAQHGTEEPPFGFFLGERFSSNEELWLICTQPPDELEDVDQAGLFRLYLISEDGDPRLLTSTPVARWDLNEELFDFNLKK